MTFLSLAYDTLERYGSPLSIQDIWLKATEYGFVDQLRSNGKTPVKTLEARIYLDIRDNGHTKFIQCSKRPSTFFIKDVEISTPIEEKEQTKTKTKSSFHEKDLHALLSSFVASDSHFKCYTKTISHEKSKKKKKGENEWLHPDLVGVYFPFNDYIKETTDLIQQFNESIIRLFSFEMKIKLNFSNLREYYFQAVSNSSWANEGYLVALDIDDSNELLEELLRLNNAFGIGIIKLNLENIEQSEIIVAAKPREVIDWDTVDRLAYKNPDFKEFITSVINSNKINSIHKEDFDKIILGEDVAKYIKEHKIKI